MQGHVPAFQTARMAELKEETVHIYCIDIFAALQTARMDELNAKAEEVETEVKAMKKEAAKQLAAGSALKNAMASHEAAIEELRTKRADILEAAQMQQACLLLSALIASFADSCTALSLYASSWTAADSGGPEAYGLG